MLLIDTVIKFMQWLIKFTVNLHQAKQKQKQKHIWRQNVFSTALLAGHIEHKTNE